MGIDVYLYWDGMTKKEHEAQFTGFSIVSGNVGYLREAYHGAPYATKALVTEDWDEQPYCRHDDGKVAFHDDKKNPYWLCKDSGFVIPNEELIRRLPAVIAAAKRRLRQVYRTSSKSPLAEGVVKSFTDFVALHGEKEREGKHPRIVVSY